MCSEFHSKYKLQHKIGEGTFSEVLKCQEFSTGQTLAVKILKKHFKHVSEAKCLPELIVLEQLSRHPNVLPLLEYMFDPQEGKMFMLFELMEMSLYELIQSRKRCLPETKVKNLFYQILRGVDHLHSHGIFHRDIKPENILIRRTVVKLADLGSVRSVHSQQPYTEYISTRWYRAPECILTAGCYGPKMDVWACGCVFYELLTSKAIFPGFNEIDQLTKIHQVTGTPSPRILMKIQRKNCRIGEIKFSPYPCINLAVILPFTSEMGRELLKRMLIYDPDVRTNVRRLLEHRYFNDLREIEYLSKQQEITRKSKQWTNPLLLSVLNTEKKLKLKPTTNIVPIERKMAESKLTTNSWAPSTNTSRVVLTQSKSKPNNNIPSNNVRRRPGQSPVKVPVKKNPAVKQTVKPPKIKTNSLGILPSINNSKQKSLKLTAKSQVGSFSLKAATKGFLPPIPEQ